MNKVFDSLSDEALASMTQDGNRAAFEVLCDRHLPCVYNRLRALLPPEAVEDVTQEVFVAVLRGIDKYRRDSLFRTWISSLVRHKVADYYRKQNRRPTLVPLVSETDNLALSEDWEERALIRATLRNLPPHYQEVLLLRFVEGLPFNQVASILDISLEATKSRYRRAVAAMAREMDVNQNRSKSKQDLAQYVYEPER
jgi:RNA polymerase sigma factor (sigma-70 family)